jgi:hypothetical protein
MNNFDRIAEHLNHKDWDTLIEFAKETDVEFTLPDYLFYGKFGQDFCNNILLEEIKKINFKLSNKDDKIVLTRNTSDDKIES